MVWRCKRSHDTVIQISDRYLKEVLYFKLYSVQKLLSILRKNLPRVMSPRRPRVSKAWSMYPEIHDNVSSLLEDDGLFFDFQKVDDSVSSIMDYDTHIMGRFNCHNDKCFSNGWSSKKIAITIRMYSGNKYNARVYHQSCKGCNWISRPELDDSYAERIAYRLKKWCGIVVEPPPHSGQSSGPHQRALCEGCKSGHCSESF